MDEQLRNEVAAFRFGLIAPVIQRNLHPGERYTLLRKIADQSYKIPESEKSSISIRSLERYLQAYEQGGRCAQAHASRKERQLKGIRSGYLETGHGLSNLFKTGRFRIFNSPCFDQLIKGFPGVFQHLQYFLGRLERKVFVPKMILESLLLIIPIGVGNTRFFFPLSSLVIRYIPQFARGMQQTT